MDQVRQTSTVAAGVLMIVALALLSVGVVMVGSTSASPDHPFLSGELWRSTFVRQAVFAVVGLGLLAGVARWASRLLFSNRRIIAWVACAAIGFAVVGLIAAFIPGFADARRGSLRWVQLGPASWDLRFQPSEAAKLALVLFLAWLLTRPSINVESFRRGFLPAVIAIGLLVALVGKEDFGTGVLIGAVGFLVLFVAGCQLVHLLLTGAAGALGLALLIRMEPYRLERIVGFLNPYADELGVGYHPLQSLRTIASGGWLGVGLGAGIQKHGYLPESQTDFIFAIICEETGLLGGLLVIGLFLVLVWLGLRTMWMAHTPFERLLAFGLTALIGLQAAMHIAVVTVCAPTTGISLPLISAGGSGLLISCMALGLLAAIAARGPTAQESKDPTQRFRVGVEPA
jgi:cell division protein FtsW